MTKRLRENNEDSRNSKKSFFCVTKYDSSYQEICSKKYNGEIQKGFVEISLHAL